MCLYRLAVLYGKSYTLESVRSVTTQSPEGTREIGERLGKLAEPGDVILLVGDLGAGKTCLTQGIAWGLDIEGYISSPSFVLVKQYTGRLTLYHMDLYRLDMIEEIADLGLDDYLYGSGVSVVEWAQKGLDVLPAEYLLIRLQPIGETERRIGFEPKGERYRRLVADLWN